MNSRLILSAAVLILMIVGCNPRYNFVVRRDVPTKPSVVVIPASDYLNQVEFANTLESYVILSGIKVVTRPLTKEVETTKHLSGAKVESEQAVSGEAQQRERYLAYDEIQADYIIFCYADSRQVKIVKRDTKEILTVFTLQPDPVKRDEVIVYDALRSIGLLVKPVTTE